MPHQHFIPRLAAALLPLLLAGCMLGPNYHRPESPEVAGYAAQSTRTLTQSPEVSWWKTFQDERLNTLIEQAVTNNLDLRAAAARIREARALRAEAAAEFWPQLTGRAGFTHSKSSENAVPSASRSSSSSASSGSSGSGTGGTGTGTGSSSSASSSAASSGGSGPGAITDNYQLGFDATWELDLFGRIRRGVRAADADLQAQQEAERGTLITLLGEVARNYIDLRGFQRELDIINQNITAQIETVRITDIRYKAGLTSELDVTNARAQLAATRSTIPPLQTQIRASIHRLGVLAGQPPETLLDELLTTAALPAAPPQVPVGLPGDLLRRRPDIRQRERELAATNERVGESIAEMFPRVTLNGSAGLSSAESGTLFERASRTWSVGPAVSAPIFRGGALRAATEANRARYEEALYSYQQTVLTALEDAENAITTYQHEWERRSQLDEAVKANQRAFDLANALYTRGLTDFLNVLDAQRRLFLSQDELAQSDRVLSTNVVAIYKALGGGWEEKLPTQKTEQPPAQTIAAGEPTVTTQPASPQSMTTESTLPAASIHRH